MIDKDTQWPTREERDAILVEAHRLRSEMFHNFFSRIFNKLFNRKNKNKGV